MSGLGGSSNDDDLATNAISGAAAAHTVAVLGGTGLIGSSIARAFLDGGHEVVVLARHDVDVRRAPLLEGATLVLGDAREPSTLERVLEGVGHVVSALAAPHPAESAKDPLAQFEAELPVLLDLLERVAARRGIGFTFLSSGGAIYGDVEELPVNEEAECHPVSPYGVTKLAAERYVLMAATRREVPVRILRVANAIGASQTHKTGQGVIAALLHGAQTGTAVRLFGDGSSVRDYVDVADIATAAVTLSSLDQPALVVNVGSGVGYRLDAVVQLVEDVTGEVIKIEQAPLRPTDVRAITLDVSRLRGLMEWHPRALRKSVEDSWAQWCAWRDDARSVTP
ncbi:MAG TPA: NAD-dependent epimerase/dehydratase family protein [Acidimicrobiales bacterium]|nr:NAD-dependent epimerase/dehydratase family protein [Acidimicrobiales bacterium]